MSKGTIASLLSDAYLVLEFAVRTGRLPNDNLPNAIEACEEGARDHPLPLLAPLSKAMNEAIVSIYPVRLDDLRAGRTPFNERFTATKRWAQYFLCALTVVIAALIAFYSYSLQIEEAALREYDRLQQARIPEKVIALRRLIKDAEVWNAKDPRYEQYQRDVLELKDLDARFSNAMDVVRRLGNETIFPFQAEIRSFTSSISSGPDKGEVVKLDEMVDLNEKYKGPECADLDPSATQGMDGKVPKVVQITRERRDEFCLMSALDIRSGWGNYVPAAADVSKVQNLIVLQSVWILPFLSGLLGAAVFILRDSLNVVSAGYSVSRTLVRLAIGGVSGIIIGWFWSPSGALANELRGVSSLPLALSFVTGYSIDVLYSVLERIRRSVAVAQGAETARSDGSNVEPGK